MEGADDPAMGFSGHHCADEDDSTSAIPLTFGAQVYMRSLALSGRLSWTSCRSSVSTRRRSSAISDRRSAPASAKRERRRAESAGGSSGVAMATDIARTRSRVSPRTRGRVTATPSRTAGRCSTGSVSRRIRSGSRISWRRCCTSPEGCRCRSRASTTARPACPRSGRPAQAARAARPGRVRPQPGEARQRGLRRPGWATPVRTTGSPIADVACSSSRGRTATKKATDTLRATASGSSGFSRLARRGLRHPDGAWRSPQRSGPTAGATGTQTRDDIRRVTRAINGGLIGLSDRIDWLHRTKAVWLDDA